MSHNPRYQWPDRFQLVFFDCPTKNGDCRENEIIKVGCLFTFWILSLRGRSNDPNNVRDFKSTFYGTN